MNNKTDKYVVFIYINTYIYIFFCGVQLMNVHTFSLFSFLILRKKLLILTTSQTLNEEKKIGEKMFLPQKSGVLFTNQLLKLKKKNVNIDISS